MRGPISEARTGGPGVAAPMALRRAVPAVYQEDPLFAELCHAFDELISPLISAVDCFPAYLDPWLAPDDFLPWLADLVGYGEPPPDPDAARGLIADAVRSHGVRGTPGAVRSAAARAAGVPDDYVVVDDPGGTRWSTVPFAAHDWPADHASVRVLIQQGRDPDDVADDVRAALQAEAGVHCGLAVEVHLAPAPPAPIPAAPMPATPAFSAPESNGPVFSAPEPAPPEHTTFEPTPVDSPALDVTELDVAVPDVAVPDVAAPDLAGTDPAAPPVAAADTPTAQPTAPPAPEQPPGPRMYGGQP